MFLSLVIVDVFLLKRVQALLSFATEWMSIERKWMERSMIVGYGLSASVNTLFDFRHSTRPHRWDPFVIALLVLMTGFVCAVMWWRQKDHDGMRVYRLLSTNGIQARLFVVTIGTVITLLDLMPAPHRWSDMCYPLAMFFYVLFEYAISLPQDGEKGKKRKAALAKLKEMFGTSWIVAPIPQPR